MAFLGLGAGAAAGSTPAWLPYALAGASAVANLASQKELDERRRKILDRMEEFQTGKARQSERSIDDFINAIDPARRAVQNADIRSELQQGLDKSVGAAQALAKPDNFEGRVTDNYTTRRAANDATTTERLKRAMAQLAVIGTPAERSLTTGFALGDAASGVDAANSAIRRTTSAYNTALNGQRPDAFLTFASDALGGMSRASASRGAARGRL